MQDCPSLDSGKITQAIGFRFTEVEDAVPALKSI